MMSGRLSEIESTHEREPSAYKQYNKRSKWDQPTCVVLGQRSTTNRAVRSAGEQNASWFHAEVGDPSVMAEETRFRVLVDVDCQFVH